MAIQKIISGRISGKIINKKSSYQIVIIKSSRSYINYIYFTNGGCS